MKRVTKIVVGSVDLGATDEREDTARRIVQDAAISAGPSRWIAEPDGTSSRLEERRPTPDGVEWCFIGRIYY